MVRARITSKAQITVPRSIRDRLGVGPGDALEFRCEEGRVFVEGVRFPSVADSYGILRVDRLPSIREERAVAREESARRWREQASETRG